MTTTGESQAIVGVRKGEMTADGGNKRRKFDNHQILSSPTTYLQLRSRTIVVTTSEKEKKTKRRLVEVEELVNYGEEEVVNVFDVERNKVLSGFLRNSPGEFERGEVEDEGKGLRSRSERAKVGGGEEEETEDGCFESTSCNLDIDDQRRTEEETSLSELRGEVDGEDEKIGNLASTARSGADGRPGRRSTALKTTRVTNLSAKMPSEEEIERFFTTVETEHRKSFMDKYNYDVVNDVPKEGRYQWVKAETMK